MRRRWIVRLVIAWLVLLALSTTFRATRGFTPEPDPDLAFAEIEVPPTVAPGGRVRLAYRLLQPNAKSETPFLFLHGNPVAGKAMLPLAGEFPADRTILLPDLPGLGHSGKNLSRLSAKNQAEVLLGWLDQRGVKRVHAVAYSQGGTTALALADKEPERLASLSLLAAVGVQEQELLGRHDWNQPLYRLWEGFLGFLRWGTPHFGLFDKAALSTSTARNFADTDLRPNRRILENLTTPIRVFHSPGDRLVPVNAARVHAHIAPGAKLIEMPGGHLGPITEPAPWATAINAFIEEVESDRTTKPSAANRDTGLGHPGDLSTGSGATWLIAGMLFLFVFLSEDLACLAGGLLAAGGLISPTSAIGACFAGIWISDIGLYLVGSSLGGGLVRSRLGRKLADAETLERYRAAFAKRGLAILLTSRFLPGTRAVTYVAAGTLRYGLVRFALVLAVAGAVWTPILVGLSYWLGQPILRGWESAGPWVLPLGLALLLVLYALYRGICIATTREGRLSLRGRWVRWTRPEFWSTWVRYLPVFLQGFWLAVKHRGTLVWASCNPGMKPLSGLALESKSETLALNQSGTSPIAPWHLIEPHSSPEVRLAVLSRFQETLPEPWPLVLKPDKGERGEGVSIVRDRAAAARKLREHPDALIAQAYVKGPEFGVFYYRFPGETRGRLFSITEKILPEAEGDGVRTVDELILAEPRGAALAAHYRAANASQLNRVPAKGERVKLTELGTHRLGAIFRDGNHHRTEALESAIDEALRPLTGFHFGRVDLRAASVEAFRRGEDFRILEINGVSSEATDLFDPKHGALAAWRILLRQWRLAFAIGAANRERGEPPARLRELVRTLYLHRKRNRKAPKTPPLSMPGPLNEIPGPEESRRQTSS